MIQQEVSMTAKMEKASIQVTMSSIFLRDRLGLLVRIIRPSKTSFGSDSDWAMLACNKSLNSTNFPGTIWPTRFAGTGAHDRKVDAKLGEG